jgi:hypothetical protein
MRLRDLDAMFLTEASKAGHRICSTLAEAQGVMFQCPKCSADKEVIHEGDRNFVRGPHYIICWFVGKVPDDLDPKPGRWNPSGTGFDDLTFVGPGAYSVLLTGPGCGWHGFIVNGNAE